MLRGIQAAAKEYASDGVTENAYCPGIVRTDMWVEIDRRFAELIGADVVRQGTGGTAVRAGQDLLWSRR